MRDDRSGSDAGAQPEATASTDARSANLGLRTVASGVGHRLAGTVAGRRRLIKGTAAVGSAAVALHYVKPNLQSLGIPAALAVSGPNSDKDKKDKKDK